MEDPQDQKRSEELKNRAVEAKRKAFEAEVHHIETETTRRAQELLQAFRMKEEQEFREKIKLADIERQTQEEALRNQETEISYKLEEVQQKRAEERRVEEEFARKKVQEEEQQRLEEIAHLKAEDERRKREEESRRQFEEQRLKEEEDKRKREEQQRRIELERQQREEEQRKQQEERQKRVRTLIENAENFLASEDYENALVEIAKALVNDPANPRALELEAFIKGIQKKDIQPAPEIEVEKPKKQKQEKVAEPLPSEIKRTRIPMIVVISIAIIIIGIIIVIQINKRVFTLPITVAVLPWTSTTNSLEENIIGSSIAEEVVNRLECAKPIHMMGYSSAYNLAHHAKDYTRDAFRSGYSYIFQGKVTRTDDNISVDVKFIDSLGKEGWRGHYEKPLKGLADLPREISKGLVKALDISDEDYSLGFLAPRTSTNADAYLLYLRGLELLHRETYESYENAYLLFLQAVQQDPTFAEGLSAAADVLASMLDKGWSRGDSVHVQSIHLAEASIRANPLLYRGYYTLGKLFSYKKEYLKALANLDSALVLAPNNNLIYFETGKIYLKVGKFNDAINAFLQAQKVNSYDPDVLRTLALAHQLAGTPWKSMQYHEAALKCVNDSLSYLAGPFINTILSDPDLRLKQSNRIVAACFRLINSNSQDYAVLYQLAHLRQVMGDVEGEDMLKKTENTIQDILRKNPKDTRALAYLALTLTRLGRFSDAIGIADRAVLMDPMNAEVKYHVAQMYSIQMYSQKENKLDEKKKELSLKYLGQALMLNYTLEELTSADFYNMFDRAEFKSIIQDELK